MTLSHLWFEMFDGNLVRADHVVGIEVNRTPELMGKPSRWLLDVVLAVPVGGGVPGETWTTSPLHRTLTQSSHSLDGAPGVLARFLALLDADDAAGIVTAGTAELDREPRPDRTMTVGGVRLAFTAFHDLPSRAALDPTDTDGPARSANEHVR